MKSIAVLALIGALSSTQAVALTHRHRSHNDDAPIEGSCADGAPYCDRRAPGETMAPTPNAVNHNASLGQIKNDDHPIEGSCPDDAPFCDRRGQAESMAPTPAAVNHNAGLAQMRSRDDAPIEGSCPDDAPFCDRRGPAETMAPTPNAVNHNSGLAQFWTRDCPGGEPLCHMVESNKQPHLDSQTKKTWAE